jgi:hypothetical protein
MRRQTIRETKWGAAVLTLGLLAGATAALAAPAKEEFLRELRTAGETPVDLVTPAPGSRLLFFEIPAQELRGPQATVDLKVHTDGHLWLHERLALDVPADGDAVAVELLGWNPDKLAELRRIAEAPGTDVRIAVWLDGRRLRELRFADFVHYNETLARTGFRPVEARSEILVPAPSVPDFNSLEKYNVACGEECGRQLDQCELFCDPYGGPQGCEQCRRDLDTCQQWCATCPAVKEWTDTVLLAVLPTYQPPICLGFPAGKSYYPVTARTRVTRYRRTTNCDYSVTTTVLSVKYVDQPCYQDRRLACSPSYGLNPTCVIPWNYA